MRARSAPAFRRRLSIVAPETLVDAVHASADARLCSVGSWIRQACLQALAEESVRSGTANGLSLHHDHAVERLGQRREGVSQV
jgi:hypothetical protein